LDDKAALRGGQSEERGVEFHGVSLWRGSRIALDPNDVQAMCLSRAAVEGIVKSLFVWCEK
jgi:hypothetical protein